MFMAFLLGTEVPTDTLDTDGKTIEHRGDTAGAPIFDLAEIDDDPTHGQVDYEDDSDGERIPLFVRADITAPGESERKPRDEDRPMMNVMGIIGGCNAPHGNELVELLRVREPRVKVDFTIHV